MKNIFNKFAFFIALSFVFISCGNLTTSENDDSIPQGKGKITISTDLQNARSVLPTAIDETTTELKWELVGTKDDTQQIIESWTDGADETGTVTAYKLMTSNSGIVIDTGTWDFTLTASLVSDDGSVAKVLVSEIVNATIKSGENKLNFVMQEATENAASGRIEFTLNFPGDVVDTVEAKLFKYENNDTEISNQTLSVEYSSTDNYSSVKYSYPDATGTTGTTSSPLSAGYYILKIELQQKKVDTTTPAVEPKTINTYSCLIRVAPGLLSTGKYTLPDLAQLYTISYLDVITNDDGTTSTENATFDSTETITVTYNEYTSFELPTPIKDGYTFLGWYTDETYDTPASNDGTYKISTDTTLYAKWVEAVSGITHANNTLYISSYEGLKVFRDIVNGSLKSNITIPGDAANSGASVNCNAGTPVTTYNAELQSNITIDEDWTPIGVYTNASSQVPYVGEFKGNNNTITFDENVSINSQAAGLFGAISTNCNISNLIIKGNIQSSSTSTSYVGGIVGYATGGSILNCVNRAKIQGTWAGGIAGKTQSTSFNGCVNFGEINGTNYSAGIVGSAASDTSINLCVNIGKITSDGTSCGISGDVPTEITVKNCINLGTLSATNYIYGISSGSGTISSNISAGKFEGTVQYSCYAVSYSASNTNYYDNSICADNNLNTGSALGMATSDFSSWSPDNLVWSAAAGRYPLPNIVATDSSEGISESVWREICELAKVDTSSSGSSGTVTGITFAGYDIDYTDGAPRFYITTADGLATFRNMVNGTIEGTVTIPKDESYNGAFLDYTVTSDNTTTAIYGKLMSNIELPSDKNWIPIGSSDRPFTGSFNGNFCTISNLNINATTDNQGLFGVIQGTSSSEFESCTITSLVVEGNITSSACNVGGIAGKATYTYFENCVNKATVESTSEEENVGVAGIAGYVSNVKMKYCYNAGNVKANSCVAGIAGYETASDTYNNYAYCINSGTITGGTNYSSIIGVANSSLGLGPCANYGKIISTTDKETGCIIGTCMTSGAEITQVSDILSVGPIETQGTYHVITKTANIDTSYYDNSVLSSEDVTGLYGYETSFFIDDDPQIDFYEDWYYTPGVYPIPNIEEYVSEVIWKEIVAAATPQNSGSSGTVTGTPVSDFSTLQTNIAKAPTDGTVTELYLTNDINMTEYLDIKSGQNIVLKTNGNYSIYRGSGFTGSFFTVNSGATFKLGNDDGIYKITLDGRTSSSETEGLSASYPFIKQVGTLIVSNCIMQYNKNSSSSVIGGAIYSEGTTTITNTSFMNNANTLESTTEGFGGAIYLLNNGNATISNCTFENNTTYQRGGAIYIGGSTSNTVITVSGSTFKNNIATNSTGNGGAICVSSMYGTVSLTSLTCSNNCVDNATPTSEDIAYRGSISSVTKNIGNISCENIYIDKGNTLNVIENINNIIKLTISEYVTGSQIINFNNFANKANFTLSDTNYTISEQGYVESSGGGISSLTGTEVTSFDALKEAINADAEVIIITRDITITECLDITRAITIAANYKVIVIDDSKDSGSSNYAFCVNDGGKLTLGGGSGVLTFKQATDKTYATIGTTTMNATVEININNNVKFTENPYYCISFVAGTAGTGAVLNINGGEFVNNSYTPIQINNKNAVCNITGGTIANNSSSANNCAGIYVKYGNLTITGGNITDNTYTSNSSYSGSSIRVPSTSNGSVIVNGETLTANATYTTNIIDGKPQE